MAWTDCPKCTLAGRTTAAASRISARLSQAVWRLANRQNFSYHASGERASQSAKAGKSATANFTKRASRMIPATRRAHPSPFGTRFTMPENTSATNSTSRECPGIAARRTTFFFRKPLMRSEESRLRKSSASRHVRLKPQVGGENPGRKLQKTVQRERGMHREPGPSDSRSQSR